MKVYTLQREQILPISLEKAWSFFSNPKNLPDITPAYLGFNITNKSEINEMYEGQIITYKVKPVLGIKLSWCTEIKTVDYQKKFIDEQRFGPYKFWHHKHFFKPVPGGVLCTDLVHYALPFTFLGQLAHWLFVKKQLKNIFDYRYNKLNLIFAS